MERRGKKEGGYIPAALAPLDPTRGDLIRTSTVSGILGAYFPRPRLPSYKLQALHMERMHYLTAVSVINASRTSIKR